MKQEMTYFMLEGGLTGNASHSKVHPGSEIDHKNGVDYTPR